MIKWVTSVTRELVLMFSILLYGSSLWGYKRIFIYYRGFCVELILIDLECFFLCSLIQNFTSFINSSFNEEFGSFFCIRITPGTFLALTPCRWYKNWSSITVLWRSVYKSLCTISPTSPHHLYRNKDIVIYWTTFKHGYLSNSTLNDMQRVRWWNSNL